MRGSTRARSGLVANESTLKDGAWSGGGAVVFVIDNPLLYGARAKGAGVRGQPVKSA
jgi:hypothetical protein